MDLGYLKEEDLSLFIRGVIELECHPPCNFGGMLYRYGVSYIKRKLYPSLIEEKKVDFILENFINKHFSQRKLTWYTPDKNFTKHIIF